MSRRTGKGLKRHWFQILLSLGDRDLHGLQIMREVLDRTEGEMHLWPGMLYGALRGMEDTGLVVETACPDNADAGGGRPRYYRITDQGRRVLVKELERLEAYVGLARAKKLLDGSGRA